MLALLTIGFFGAVLGWGTTPSAEALRSDLRRLVTREPSSPPPANVPPPPMALELRAPAPKAEGVVLDVPEGAEVGDVLEGEDGNLYRIDEDD